MQLSLLNNGSGSMRVVVYLGLFAIATAINPNWSEGLHIGFYATILLIACIMDVVEFLSKVLPDNNKSNGIREGDWKSNTKIVDSEKPKIVKSPQRKP